MMIKSIFSGFGGQGVLMMGYVFAHGAMSKGYQVTYLPAYGAEVRGGTANCTVAVADEEIASPIASEPDYVVALNTPSLYTFQNRIAAEGTLFLNSSIINIRPTRQGINVVEIPCGEMAEKIGNPRVSNTVMMGAFIKKTGLFSPDIYMKSLEVVMGGKKKSVMEINRVAFMAGYDFLNI
ncbi:MAG: 2-oxoacid:acceptor oxidoreductase family protein [Smithellaceae bacterium]|nr:2-oxoacid:acceptor oxidoreductase family protein [Smithellaceae bacterium]